MKTRVWKGLTGREAIQNFLFSWFQDNSISYFQFRGALRLRADTYSAIIDSSSGGGDNSRKRGRGTTDEDDGRDLKKQHVSAHNAVQVSNKRTKGSANSVDGNTNKFHSGSNSKSNKDYKKRGKFSDRNRSNKQGGGGYRGSTTKPKHYSANKESRNPYHCTHCNRPGHTAERCFSNPDSKSFRKGFEVKPDARNVS